MGRRGGDGDGERGADKGCKGEIRGQLVVIITLTLNEMDIVRKRENFNERPNGVRSSSELRIVVALRLLLTIHMMFPMRVSFTNNSFAHAHIRTYGTSPILFCVRD